MNVKKLFAEHLDELAVYAFTVADVFLGDYILKGVRPNFSWLSIVSALFVAAILCFAVEMMSGVTNTAEKKAAKRRNFHKRMLFSGVAGIASGAVVPALVKSAMATMGLDL